MYKIIKSFRLRFRVLIHLMKNNLSKDTESRNKTIEEPKYFRTLRVLHQLKKINKEFLRFAY